MGSSKKNKDRDRKKRKRDRSSSRSRDRKDKHHRHHHKHKKHKRSREEHSPSISLSDLSDLEADLEIQKPVQGLPYSKQPSRVPIYEPPPVTPPSPSPPPESYTPPPLPMQQPPLPPQNTETSGKEISLSIEETNKIRARLGLKPLQTSPTVKTQKQVEKEKEDGCYEYKAGQEVHKPAENLRDKIEVEKLREKIAAQREKRLLKARLSGTKSLGAAGGDEEEDLTVWVQKSRKIDKERKEAEKRNKLLEELDEQFGIGDLVEEELSQTKKSIYNSRHLSGLRVQHDPQRFSEGLTTILTLKDSSILENLEDTLVNVNIEDTERVERNLERKRGKPDEATYDTPEIDEFGNFVAGSLLTKYDEEIEGERKKSFRIGSRGHGMEEDKASVPHGARNGAGPASSAAQKLKKLRQLTTLETPMLQLATEYLTPAEAVTFKKKKKKKKKKMLTVDDLEPLGDSEQHLGSRAARRQNMGAYGVLSVRGYPQQGAENMRLHGVSRGRVKSLKELMEDEEDFIKKEPTEDAAPEEQTEQDPDSETEKDMIELQEALTRSRRAKLNALRKGTEPELVSDALSDVPPETHFGKLPISSGKDEGSMTLNLTDEFCRSLGDIPTYGLSGNRADEDVTFPPEAPARTEEAWDTHGAWEEVDIEETKVEITSERSVPILEEEPDTGKGVVNALKLALKKGYMEKGNEKKQANATLQHLRAIHYSIEDKTVEDERRGGRGGDRYMGPTIEFREKDTYKPDVKLEYVDDEGRKLNAKEAFRYLSHKFHGKGSGKNKLEKRMKKWQEELLMKHMSSSDTPLQTLERQKEKQKQLGAAYLVLSGSKTQESLEVKK